MAIVVKSGGNAAPALVGAYGGGQGKRWSEDERQQAALIAAREAQNKSLDAQQREAKLNRDLTLQRDEAGQERSLETMRLAADLREGTAEADQLNRREDVEWGYSTQQRQEYDKLTQSYDDAVKSGDFTPDQLKEIRAQIALKKAGIAPTDRLVKKSPYPDGQDVGQTWMDEKSAVLVTRDKDGKVRKLADSPKPTFAEFSKVYASVSESLAVKNDDDGTVTPADPAKVIAKTKEIMKAYESLNSGEPAIPDAENPFTTVDPALTPGYEGLFGAGQKPDLDKGLKKGDKGPAPKTARDLEAIKWAKANPKDPRAIQILKLHKE